MSTKYLYAGIALLVGSALPFQVGINMQLRDWLGHAVLAALASFGVGTLILLLYATTLRLPWPTPGALLAVPAWAWLGGVLGALYVAASVILAPRLGAATLVALVVAGQLLASLLLDHFGLIGFAAHPFNVWRGLGAALLLFGAVLVLKF